jgi:hypothetical protein
MLAVLLGTVADRTTSQPLPGVTVSAGAVHATTRADGTFRLGAQAGPSDALAEFR